MPYGQIADGTGAVTTSPCRGKVLRNRIPVRQRLAGQARRPAPVAIHARGRGWDVHEAAVDSSHGHAVVTFAKPADTDGISLRRADSGDVQIAWQVS